LKVYFPGAFAMAEMFDAVKDHQIENQDYGEQERERLGRDGGPGDLRFQI
jgi:hypothetical protein